MDRVKNALKYYGSQHKEAVKSCVELRDRIHKSDLLVNNSDYFIHNTIDELKYRVLLKSEELKLQIDECTQELVDELDAYEKCCKEHFSSEQTSTSGADREVESLWRELRVESEEANSKLNDWSNELNELKFDETKWREIKIECDTTIKNLSDKIEKLEEELLINRFSDRKCYVDFFANANINSILTNNVWVYFMFNNKKRKKNYYSCDFK